MNQRSRLGELESRRKKECVHCITSWRDTEKVENNNRSILRALCPFSLPHPPKSQSLGQPPGE